MENFKVHMLHESADIDCNIIKPAAHIWKGKKENERLEC